MDRCTGAFVTLMKTPPRFHEVRMYLEPVTYQGKKILAHRGSCKHDKCTWSSTFASRAGLHAGIWSHRKEHILALRQKRLAEVHRNDRRWIKRDMVRGADRHTHTEEQWLAAVQSTLHDWKLSIVDLDPHHHRLMTFYSIGFLAGQAADRIMEIDTAKVRSVAS